jgi:hypothetical protein
MAAVCHFENWYSISLSSIWSKLLINIWFLGFWWPMDSYMTSIRWFDLYLTFKSKMAANFPQKLFKNYVFWIQHFKLFNFWGFGRSRNSLVILIWWFDLFMTFKSKMAANFPHKLFQNYVFGYNTS